MVEASLQSIAIGLASEEAVNKDKQNFVVDTP